MTSGLRRTLVRQLGPGWGEATFVVVELLGYVASVALLVTAVTLLVGLWGPLRYREFHQVQERLEELPGVKVVDAWGNEDVTFEDIGVMVEVAGRGRITFEGLTLESFDADERPSLLVTRLGPHLFASCELWVTPDGTPLREFSYGSGLGLARGGKFNQHLPVVVRTAQDVIANYDALVAAVGTWPLHPRYLEVPCTTAGKDGEVVPCAQAFDRDGNLLPEKVVTRLAVTEVPLVMRACDVRPLSAERQREEDRAIQALEHGFRDRPSGRPAQAP